MDVSDLNDKIDAHAQKVLIPKGFKKLGLHYFKIENNQFYGLIKNTFRGNFEDYFLVYSHECAGSYFEEISNKISVMLKDYPASVKVSDLRIIYNNSDKLQDSPYYFYSLAREYDIDVKGKENKEVWAKSITQKQERNTLLTQSESFVEEYTAGIFEMINQFGFKFFEECDVQLCHESLAKPLREKKNKHYLQNYEDYLKIIEAYMQLKNIPVVKKKTSWLKDLFNY